MTLDNPNLYLSVKQVADRFGVSTDTIWRWKRVGTFPAACRLGPRMTRWRLADILEYEARLAGCFALHLDTTGMRLTL